MGRFQRGETIFHQADPAAVFYIVHQGWVKIYRITPLGDETVIGVFTRGQNFAEIAALAGGGYPADAAAVTDVTLVAVPVRWLIAQIEREPATALTMLASVSRQVRRLVDEIEALKGRSGIQRVAEFLVAESVAKEGMSAVKLPYEKALIASRLGMKAESLSRVFHRLRSHGVLVKNDVAIVKDIGTLKNLIETERSGGGASNSS